jgi:hypothetical protein
MMRRSNFLCIATNSLLKIIPLWHGKRLREIIGAAQKPESQDDESR